MAGAARLRVVQFTDPGGDPYTAFVALDDDQWSEVVEQWSGDLSSYYRHILSVVAGHSPAPDEIRAARQAFAQCYTETHTGAKKGQARQAPLFGKKTSLLIPLFLFLRR